MFYSEKLGLLFIACPKTGSTSVETFLSELDPEGTRFKIHLPERTIDSRDVTSNSLGHATAREFRDVLGEERFGGLFVFGFVREPIEKLVSSYFFIRQNRLRTVLRSRSEKGSGRLIARQLINIALARTLPFPAWALLFPMKDGARYFVDEEGRLCVNGLGSLERLSCDLDALLSEGGVNTQDRKVGHVNRSKHSKATRYVKPNSLLDRVLKRRYADDVALYALVAEGPALGLLGMRLQEAAAGRLGTKAHAVA